MEVANRRSLEKGVEEPSPRRIALDFVVGLVKNVRSMVGETLDEKLYVVSKDEYNNLRRYLDIYADIYVNYALFDNRRVRFILLENLDALYKQSIRRTLDKLNLEAVDRDHVIKLVEDVVANCKVV